MRNKFILLCAILLSSCCDETDSKESNNRIKESKPVSSNSSQIAKMSPLELLFLKSVTSDEEGVSDERFKLMREKYLSHWKESKGVPDIESAFEFDQIIKRFRNRNSDQELPGILIQAREFSQKWPNWNRKTVMRFINQIEHLL